MSHDSVKALAFDVFGTVVDLVGTLPCSMEIIGTQLGIIRDWKALAPAWIEEYLAGLAAVQQGGVWKNAERLTREGLNRLGALQDLMPVHKDALNLAWRRLSPWPTAVEGLTRLAKKFTLVTLANGNVAMLRAVAQFEGLPWHQILSADAIKHYKPDPEVYEYGIASLGLEPGEIMMVAAHTYDLDAAKTAGMMTAFVRCPGGDTVAPTDTRYDVLADDFNDLAKKLGA